MKKQILTVLLLCLLLTVTLLLVACNDTGDTQTPDEPGDSADTGDPGNTQNPADNKKTASEGLQYTFADDGSGFIVSGLGSCADTEIVIPDSYRDKPVVGIADRLFAKKTYITDVTLPNSLTYIGFETFSGCTGLTSIVIPDNVVVVGENAFFDCTNLSGVYISDIAAWCKINFKNDRANPMLYAGNIYLNKIPVKELVIPNSVTGIGNYAFFGCTGLTSITIPDSVTNIGDGAFRDCVNLISVNISGGIKRIRYWTFSGCTSLENITIPNSVTHIAYESFSNCISLTNIIIPNSVISIDNNAFRNCTNLIKIIIPNSVTSIGNAAFGGCYKLVEVYNLSTLTIEKGSDSNGGVGYYTLAIYTSLSEESKAFTDENGFQFYKNGETCYLLGYTGNEIELTLPQSCHGKNYAIYQYAFTNYKNLTSITIPNGVTSIGEQAFSGCTSLTSVTIPNGVTSIGNNAFV